MNKDFQVLKDEIICIINNLKYEIRCTVFGINELVLLRKEIEDNYINNSVINHLKKIKDDIRMKIYNPEHPVAEKIINHTKIKICQGLIRKGENTYWLFLDEEIIGEFYSIDAIKLVIKKVEEKLHII